MEDEQENDLKELAVDGVRALTRQVTHPSRISREILGQMAVIAFTLGIVFAAITEALARQDWGWLYLFSFLFGALLYLYGWTSRHWYQAMD